MKCAVVDLNTGNVVNTIMADASATPPPGARLVELDDDAPVDARWGWSQAEGFKIRPEFASE